MLKTWRSWPLYPVLLALALVLKVFLDADINIHASLRVMVILVVGAILLTAICVLLLGQVRGAFLAAALILIARSGDPGAGLLAALLAVLLVIAFLQVRRLRPRAAFPRQPNPWLNGLSAIVLGLTIVSGAQSGILFSIATHQGQPPGSLAPASASAQPSATPDIYMIMLDGYPRADTLARLFNYDNTPFLSALANQGFEVEDLNNSNYIWTALTMSSMYQMQYLQELPGATDSYPGLRRLINDNPVWDELRSRGYVIAANQGYWEQDSQRDADVSCDGGSNDFEMWFPSFTLGGALSRVIDPGIEADAIRSNVTHAWDCLDSLLAPTKQPKFVYIHVALPHLPIVFTATGSAADLRFFGKTRPDMDVTDAEFEAAYTSEIEYLNSQTLLAVSQLAQRPDQPVVIVFSDHGSESRLNFSDPIKGDVPERLSNFMAALTPGHPNLYSCDTEPINMFATLLDGYFGDSMPMRDSHHYLSPDVRPFDFTEVPDPDGSGGCAAPVP